MESQTEALFIEMIKSLFIFIEYVFGLWMQDLELPILRSFFHV